MNALRVRPRQQQTFCGFNVPMHLQPRAASNLLPDEAYRMIFMSGVSKHELAAEEAQATGSRSVFSLGHGAFKKLMHALSFTSDAQAKRALEVPCMGRCCCRGVVCGCVSAV